jgi:hypothetical protein
VTPPRLGRPRPVAWRCLLYSHSRLGAAAVWSEGDGVEERGSRDGRGCLPGWPRPHPCRVNGGQVVKPEPCASARPRTQSDGAQIQLRSHSSFQRGQNRASCAAGGRRCVPVRACSSVKCHCHCHSATHAGRRCIGVGGASFCRLFWSSFVVSGNR